jgi:phage-related protein
MTSESFQRSPAGAQVFSCSSSSLVGTQTIGSQWPGVGSGCREIRVRDPQGIYQVFYVAVMDDVVCVLHCSQKKTQKTAKADLDLGRQRFKEMVEKERRRVRGDR